LSLEREYIPPQGLEESWFGISPAQGTTKRYREFAYPPYVPPPPIPPTEGDEELGEFVVYPFAQDAVLSADPTYSYTAEYTIDATDYAELAYWELNKAVDILSVFANLVCALKSGDATTVTAKWQIKSGVHAGGGSYIDLTDAFTETSTSHIDHSRSGVVSKLTSFPTTCPITLALMAKKTVAAADGKAKIKSNTYLRIGYKV